LSLKVLFHVKHDESRPLVGAGAQLGVRLLQTQAESLLDFERLLITHAVPAGIVARADLPRLRERHVLDCLRAAAAVTGADRSAYDLGSGAGLPGLVVAIARPDLKVTLVEARRRRAAFLEFAVEQLGVTNVEVAPTRLEELNTPADLCFARALAPLPESWNLAERLLQPRGRLVYFAGEGATEPFAAPGARVLDILTASVLERSGPLVIMAR